MAFILLIFCFSLVFLFFINKKTFSKMEILTENIPGPRRYPIIGAALQLGSKAEEILPNMSRIARSYANKNNIVKLWIGPKLFVALFSPDDVRDVLTSGELVNKSFAYDFVEPFVGLNSVFNAKGEVWQKRRKVILPTFHGKAIENSYDSFNSNSKILVDNLISEIGKNDFDVYAYLDFCAMDIIAETALGVHLNIQREKNSNLLYVFHELESLLVYRGTRLWAYPDIIFNMSSSGRRQKELIKTIRHFLKKIVESSKINRLNKNKTYSNASQHRKISVSENKKKTFIDELLKCNESGKLQLTDEEVENEILSIIVAFMGFQGQSTTSSAISLVLHALMKHQDIQEKVFRELHNIFKGSDRDVTPHDVSNMHYLEKVIKETLRIWPVAPFIIRDIPKDFKLKSGHTLPAGSNAFIFIYELHRNQDVFPNPEVFDPERFNSQNSQGRSQYAYCPFAAGPRMCIGYKYALVEMKIILSHILRKYKILSPKGNSPDIALSCELLLRSKTGVHIRIEKI